MDKVVAVDLEVSSDLPFAMATTFATAAAPPLALLLTNLALVRSAFAGAGPVRSAIAISGPSVDTAFGTVLGRAIGNSEQFLGLPYAEAPLADLRFAPAQPWTRRFNGTFDATRYGPPCHQTTGNWDDSPTETPRDPDDEPLPSEDCLLLNIFRPSAKPSTPLPVLVWIHGGGLCGGSGSLAWHNATKLVARENVIVVTLNYRLGPLGFLALPELQRTYGANGGGNGFRDQLAALRWVKAHIGAFGGDAGALTVFGESSGGVSTCVLNASPEAAGLFRRAIVQSGPCIVAGEGWGPGSSAYGLELGANLTKRLGAPTLADLRRLPPQLLQWNNDTLMDDNFAGYFVDGLVLPTASTPRDAYASGKTHATELIVGATSKDGTAQMYGTAPLANATAAEWRSLLAKRWGPAAAAVMAQYPLQARFGGDAAAAYIEADADERVVCPSLEMAQLASAIPGRTARHYSFAHLMLACDAGFATGTLPLPRSPALRVSHAGWASHGSDVKYTFSPYRTMVLMYKLAALVFPLSIAASHWSSRSLI